MKSFKDVSKQLDEVLTKSTPAGEWVHDFVHSDNPKFAGKSPAKRKQMALAAYYAKKNEGASPSQNSKTEVDMNESKDTSHVINHDSEDVKASHNYVHKQASEVAKRNNGKLTRHSNTHSEVNYPNGHTTHIKTTFNGKHAVSHIKHHYSESATLDEDQYTSEYKIKSYVDPITGENKQRKIRPHRVDFKNSKMRGEPAQKDAEGDYGMKEDVNESRGHKIIANYFRNKDIVKNIASQSPEEKAEHEKKHREAMTKAHNEYVKNNPNSIFKPMKEEAEQIDELSKGTLVRYINRASQDVHNKALEAGKDSEKPGKASDFIKKYQKSGKRQTGITKAAVSLARKKTFEEVEKWHVYDTKTNKVHSTHDSKSKAEHAYNKLNKDHEGYDTPGGLIRGKYGMRKEEVQLEEDLDTAHIHQLLANKDINAQVKDGKVHVHSSDVKAAKMHLRVAGHKHEVVGGLNEDQEEDDRQAGEHHQKELEQQEKEAKKKKDRPSRPGDITGKSFTEEVEEGKVYDPFTKKMVATKPIKVQAGGGATRNGVPVETGPSKYKQGLKEEQLDELSKKTLASYATKAHHDAALQANDLGHQLGRSTDHTHIFSTGYQKQKGEYSKRAKGIDTAIKKLAKEEVMDEATTYKGIGTDVVDKKKVLNPPIPLTQKPKQVKDFKEGDEYDEKWKGYKGKSFKKESTMLNFGDFLKEAKKWMGECDYDKKMKKEELIGKQTKLDKNHNGKLDADDFKKLRKEETESIEESYPTKQHFEQMAALIKSHDDMKKRSDLAHHHAGIFKGQNPRFDHKKFMHACGVHESAICEEVEQIDELSKKTLANYVNKASHDAASGAYQGKEYTAQSNQHTAAGDWDASKKKHDLATKEFNRANKRLVNIPKATTKMAKEEVEPIEELSKSTLASYVPKAARSARIHGQISSEYKSASDRARKSSMKDSLERLSKKYKNRAWKREDGIKRAADKLAKEEVEQIDELSKNTLNSYIDKAKHHADWAHTMKFMDHKQATDIIKKREAGIGHAINKKANKEYTKEETISELKASTLKSYSNKSWQKGLDAAYDAAHNIDKEKNYQLASKRFAGSFKAKSKLDKMKEEVEQIDELSKGTLASYAKASTFDAAKQGNEIAKLGNNLSALSKVNGPMYKLNKRLAGHGKAVDKLAKEEIEKITENIHAASKELSDYAEKHSGMDKKDFHSAAKHMASGDHGALKQHIKSLDSEPRDKILTVLHKHGNDIKRYGYSMDEETLDELSKSTLGNYVKGAAKDVADRQERIRAGSKPYPGESQADYQKDMSKALAIQSKRKAGMDKAIDKLTKEEVSQEMSPYVKGTLAVMDEGKIDDLRDAQALRKAGASSYDKELKPDTKHPHIKVVKGSSYGGENQKDDDNDEKSDNGEKRGRGRPSGSKSGAR